MSKEESLSEKMKRTIFNKFYMEEDVREFISLIQVKVLMDWEGQNEFIDWLKTKSGEDLI